MTGPLTTWSKPIPTCKTCLWRSFSRHDAWELGKLFQVFTGHFGWVKNQGVSHIRGGRDNDYSASVTSFLKVVTLDVHCCSGPVCFFPPVSIQATGRGSEEQGLLQDFLLTLTHWFPACSQPAEMNPKSLSSVIPVRLPQKLV